MSVGEGGGGLFRFVTGCRIFGGPRKRREGELERDSRARPGPRNIPYNLLHIYILGRMLSFYGYYKEKLHFLTKGNPQACSMLSCLGLASKDAAGEADIRGTPPPVTFSGEGCLRKEVMARNGEVYEGFCCRLED